MAGCCVWAARVGCLSPATSPHVPSPTAPRAGKWEPSEAIPGLVPSDTDSPRGSKALLRASRASVSLAVHFCGLEAWLWRLAQSLRQPNCCCLCGGAVMGLSEQAEGASRSILQDVSAPWGCRGWKVLPEAKGLPCESWKSPRTNRQGQKCSEQRCERR